MIERLKQKVKDHPSETKIDMLFARHGESDGNALGDTCPIMHDTPLTERGRAEALKIAQYLKTAEKKVTHIYSAPKGRSRETAEIIAKELGLPVVIMDGLNERDWGVWADLRWEQASEKLDALTIDERYTFIPEGGESWQQMEQRLLASLEDIADQSVGGETVLVVTHRGCLRAILPLLAKAARDQHKDFSVATGALSHFSFDKDSFEFVGLNP